MTRLSQALVSLEILWGCSNDSNAKSFFHPMMIPGRCWRWPLHSCGCSDETLSMDDHPDDPIKILAVRLSESMLHGTMTFLCTGIMEDYAEKMTCASISRIELAPSLAFDGDLEYYVQVVCQDVWEIPPEY